MCDGGGESGGESGGMGAQGDVGNVSFSTDPSIGDIDYAGNVDFGDAKSMSQALGPESVDIQGAIDQGYYGTDADYARDLAELGYDTWGVGMYGADEIGLTRGVNEATYDLALNSYLGNTELGNAMRNEIEWAARNNMGPMAAFGHDPVTGQARGGMWSPGPLSAGMNDVALPIALQFGTQALGGPLSIASMMGVQTGGPEGVAQDLGFISRDGTQRDLTGITAGLLGTPSQFDRFQSDVVATGPQYENWTGRPTAENFGPTHRLLTQNPDLNFHPFWRRGYRTHFGELPLNPVTSGLLGGQTSFLPNAFPKPIPVVRKTLPPVSGVATSDYNVRFNDSPRGNTADPFVMGKQRPTPVIDPVTMDKAVTDEAPYIAGRPPSNNWDDPRNFHLGAIEGDQYTGHNYVDPFTQEVRPVFTISTDIWGNQLSLDEINNRIHDYRAQDPAKYDVFGLPVVN